MVGVRAHTCLRVCVCGCAAQDAGATKKHVRVLLQHIVCTHTHAHTHAHTHTHARTHARAHARARARTHTHTRAHTRTRVQFHLYGDRIKSAGGTEKNVRILLRRLVRRRVVQSAGPAFRKDLGIMYDMPEIAKAKRPKAAAGGLHIRGLVTDSCSALPAKAPCRKPRSQLLSCCA